MCVGNGTTYKQQPDLNIDAYTNHIGIVLISAFYQIWSWTTYYIIIVKYNKCLYIILTPSNFNIGPGRLTNYCNILKTCTTSIALKRLRLQTIHIVTSYWHQVNPLPIVEISSARTHHKRATNRHLIFTSDT